MSEKRYLIVGGTGFVGRRLTEMLEEDSSVRVDWLVRSRESGTSQRAVFLLEDFRSDPRLLAQYDEIVYSASASVPSTKGASALGEMESNLHPLGELLGLLGSAPGADFTYLSSAGTVYDAAFGKAQEDSPMRPLSYYAAGKIAGEAFVRVFGEGRPGRVSVVRAANLYGPGQPARPGFGLIPAICRCAVEGGTLTLHRGGRDRRDFLHIDDFCRGLIAVFGGPGGVYNLASGTSHSVREVVEIFAAVSGICPATQESEGTASPAGDAILDISRSRAMLGWEPQLALEEGIRSTWEWWRDHRTDAALA